jgi:cytochrome c
MNWRPGLCIVAVLLALHPAPAHAQLKGHGGPVRAIAVSSDGNVVLSGSFDTAAIRWSLKTQSAEQVLRFHADAVNAVAFLKDGRMATAGADARIAIWTPGREQPDRIFDGHRAPIVSLAVSPDGTRLASRWLTLPSKCWKGTRRTSTASRSRRMDNRLSALATISI